MDTPDLTPIEQNFIEKAFHYAHEALQAQEVPVGCIFVYRNTEIIALGRNTVNATKNATRHAEINCIEQVTAYAKRQRLGLTEDLAKRQNLDLTDCTERQNLDLTAADRQNLDLTDNAKRQNFDLTAERQNLDVTDHAQPQSVDLTSVFRDISVYVTVEPCIMCMAAMFDLQVEKIVFGCQNDRFGGKTVFDVSKVAKDVRTVVKGGFRAEEAMNLLKEFYKGVNPAAPASKVKVRGKK